MASNKKGDKSLNYTVFKRNDAKTYSMRFSVEGMGQIKIPLKTTDKQEADQLALVKSIEIMHDLNNDNYSGNMTFEKVADEYLAKRFTDVETADNVKRALANAHYESRTINIYLKTYFKKKSNRSLAAIKQSDLNKYVDWRKNVWTTDEAEDLALATYRIGRKEYSNPKPTKVATMATIRRENTALNGVFKYAVDMGYIRKGDKPELKIPAEKSKKRPYFTISQIDKLTNVAFARVVEANGDKRLEFQRTVLLHYIYVAVDSGLRKSEMINLNWMDITGIDDYLSAPISAEEYLKKGITLDEERIIRFKVHGKNITASEVIPKEDVLGSLVMLLDLYSRTFGDNFKPSNPVFMNFKGERLGSFDKSLNALLKAADLTHDSDNRKFSSYCFRHSYATWRLQENPPLDFYKLSINMRTSVKMIEKYYSKVVTGDHHASFSKSDRWEKFWKGSKK